MKIWIDDSIFGVIEVQYNISTSWLYIWSDLNSSP